MELSTNEQSLGYFGPQIDDLNHAIQDARIPVMMAEIMTYCASKLTMVREYLANTSRSGS